MDRPDGGQVDDRTVRETGGCPAGLGLFAATAP